MKRILSLCLAVLALPAAGGEILDRVAVTAGLEAVTLSGILRHLRFQAIVSGALVEDTEQNRRQAAEQLLDLLIVRRELDLSRYSPPTMAEADAAIERFLADMKWTPQQLAEALARAGFTEEEFRREMQARLTVTRFIDYRFAPGVQVSDEEVRAYYESEFLPALERSRPGAEKPELGAVRAMIERILTTRKVNAAMEEWLKQMRQSLRIQYFDAAFRPAGGAP
jgi:parvulin-like peptidyl-prolyl isomerase